MLSHIVILTPYNWLSCAIRVSTIICPIPSTNQLLKCPTQMLNIKSNCNSSKRVLRLKGSPQLYYLLIWSYLSCATSFQTPFMWLGNIKVPFYNGFPTLFCLHQHCKNQTNMSIKKFTITPTIDNRDF